MARGRRAFVVALDACGVGALPDAADYGDEAANTLVHVAEAARGLELPMLGGLGLGCIGGIAGGPSVAEPVSHGKLHPLGPGKDSTAGHWELMGVVAPEPMPTFPDGFPPQVLERVATAAGRGVIGNAVCDGLAAVERFGAEHLRTGELIVYTSQDSVLQLAAHVDVVPAEQLYAACAGVREAMTGDYAVGRVIARPFAGRPGEFRRTDGRRDFSLPPPTRSYLDELHDAGVPVHTVGKVAELFCGRGVDEAHRGPDNEQALAATSALVRDLDRGLVFTNLVETDQVYGHRKDIEGFHGALRLIDERVGAWLERLEDDDLLVLCADHGCDPTT